MLQHENVTLCAAGGRPTRPAASTKLPKTALVGQGGHVSARVEPRGFNRGPRVATACTLKTTPKLPWAGPSGIFRVGQGFAYRELHAICLHC